MRPLSSLYGTITRTRNNLYARGVLATHELHGPVVSIGNLAVGGSGKTPFLIALGELLKARKINFDVLSRGYGRQDGGVRLVDPEGSPRDFGDEPLLIARRLQVPVIVGGDRYEAGLCAERHFGPELHLLDDGFQHRRLARDFDIVMITPSDTQDTLLPQGRLREPLSALERADAVVLTNDTPTEGLPLSHHKVWRVQRSTVVPQVNGPCVAFCGIARPENFFAGLRSAGVAVASTRSFRDHHRYSENDVRELIKMRERSGASAFITTEKDAINLEGLLSSLDHPHVAPVQVQVQDADAVLETLLATFAQRKSRSA
jgi:tetraacyldisaccharide 4'-kinase